MTPEERVEQITQEVWKRTGWGDGGPALAEGNLCRESVKAGYEAGIADRRELVAAIKTLADGIKKYGELRCKSFDTCLDVDCVDLRELLADPSSRRSWRKPMKASNHTYIIACSSRKNKEETLFLVDRKKQRKSFWSNRLVDVRTFFLRRGGNTSQE